MPLPEKPQEIKLNQEFLLFEPSSLFPDDIRNRDLGKHSAAIDLEILPGRIFPFVAHARFSGSNGFGISPFDPDKGYRIVQDDFDLETRRAKITKAWNTPRKNRNIVNAPLYISLEPNWIRYEESGLIEVRRTRMGSFTTVDMNYLDEVQAQMDQLRLQLTFPSMGNSLNSTYVPKTEYEGVAQDTPSAEFLLQYFYPLDSGELPSDPWYTNFAGRHGVDPGFVLYVPDDLDRLSQIRAKFVIQGEQHQQSISEEDIPDKFKWKG